MKTKLYKVKEGASTTYLKYVIESKLNEIALICKLVNGINYEMTITSGNDGIHMKNSKHYKNEAIDIRTRDMEESKKILTQLWLKKWLGLNYDIILEKDHIHIEYDPKQKEKSKKSDQNIQTN